MEIAAYAFGVITVVFAICLAIADLNGHKYVGLWFGCLALISAVIGLTFYIHNRWSLAEGTPTAAIETKQPEPIGYKLDVSVGETTPKENSAPAQPPQTTTDKPTQEPAKPPIDPVKIAQQANLQLSAISLERTKGKCAEKIDLKNIGASAASEIRAFSSVSFLSDERMAQVYRGLDRFKREFDLKPDPKPNFLAAGDTMSIADDVSVQPDLLDADSVTMHMYRNEPLYFWGCIRYTTVYRNKRLIKFVYLVRTQLKTEVPIGPMMLDRKWFDEVDLDD